MTDQSCPVSPVHRARGAISLLPPTAIPRAPIVLYHDALSCVFLFLELGDLHHVLAVCQAWSSTAGSMPSIGATVARSDLVPAQIVFTSLAVHISTFGVVSKPTGLYAPSHGCLIPRTTMDGVTLALLGKRLTNLTALRVDYKLPSPMPIGFGFPAKLRRLHVRLGGGDEVVAGINAVIAAIGRLEHLSSLQIEFTSFQPKLCFAPLRSAAKLRHLHFSPVLHNPEQPSGMQLDDVRMLPLASLDGLNAATRYRLLSSPHHLRLESMPAVSSNDVRREALAAFLPYLTRLDTSDHRREFLCTLPQLSDLTLKVLGSVPAPQVSDGLACCVGLTSIELHYSSSVSSIHLVPALQPMRLLRKLDLICRSLDSLQFLPLSLHHLAIKLSELSDCIFESAELQHIFSIRGLQRLIVRAPAGQAQAGRFSVLFSIPCVELPNLTICSLEVDKITTEKTISGAW